MGFVFPILQLFWGLISGFKFYLGIGAVLFGLWKGIAWWNGWKRAKVEARKEARMEKAVTIQQKDTTRIIKVEKMLSPGQVELKTETGKTVKFKSEKSKETYQKEISQGKDQEEAKKKAAMAAIEEFKKYVQDIGTIEEIKEDKLMGRQRFIERLRFWCKRNPRKVKLILSALAGLVLGLWLAGCANLREHIKTADAVFEVIEEKKKEKSGEEVTVYSCPKKRISNLLKSCR